MIRDTSLEAYFEIKSNLGEMQQVVFDTILRLGCPTDLEIAKFLGYKDPNKVRPRRNDLLKMGLIDVCEKRECSVSKRMSTSWKITVKN
jgi:hypothetical protein